MSATLVIFIIIHVFSLGFLFESLRRTVHRIREYPLEETSKTLPFGKLRLRHVVILYIVAYAAWLLLTLWLYFSFLSGTDATTPAASGTLNLNL